MAKQTLTPGAVIPLFKNPIALHSSIDLPRVEADVCSKQIPFHLAGEPVPKPLLVRSTDAFKPETTIFHHHFRTPHQTPRRRRLDVARQFHRQFPSLTSLAIKRFAHCILLQLFCQSPRDCFFFYSVNPIKRAIKYLYRLLFFFFLRVSHFNEPLLLQNVRERDTFTYVSSLEKELQKIRAFNSHFFYQLLSPVFPSSLFFSPSTPNMSLCSYLRVCCDE